MRNFTSRLPVKWQKTNLSKVFGILSLLIALLSSNVMAQVATIGAGTLVSSAGTNGDPIYRSSTTSTFHHSKSANLLTAAQLTTAGVTSGSTISEFGYYKVGTGIPAGSNAWTINVYLKNSNASALASGTAWSTMISGATLAYTATITSANMPSTAGYWDWVLTTPFNYTGGAIESYVEWFPSGTLVTPFTTGTFTWQYSTTTERQAIGTSSGSVLPATHSTYTTQLRQYNVRLKYSNSACTGTPAPGNTTSTSNPACSGASFTLGVQNSTLGSGVTYQWDSSPDGTTWSPVSGATSANYITSQTVATYYKNNVTCAGITTTSIPLQVTINPLINCFCPFSSTNASSYFDAFSTTGGSTNITNTGSGYATGGYQNATAMTVTQQQGGTINFTTTLVGTTVGVAIWVDWNDDAVFDNATERVYNTAAYVSAASGSFVVPIGATVGSHRMRAVMDFNATSPSACGTSSGRGEAEDYTLTVAAAAPCSGAPAGVAITPAATTVCGTGGATFSATTTSNGSGFTYEWESSPAGANTWTPIASATAATYTATGVTASTDYRCIISCSGSPSTSNVATITVSAAPVNDECSAAITVTMQPTCSILTAANTSCATISANTSTSWSTSLDDDIWYRFQATGPSASINLSNVVYTSGTAVGIGIAVYNDSSDCSKVNSARELSTTNVPATITITNGAGISSIGGLIAGNFYTVRLLTSGTSSRASFNFCITDPPPMSYVSSTTTQSSTASVVGGSSNQQIIRVAIVVSGSLNPISLTQLDFNTNGSTNPADIDSAKVFYTGTSTTFSTATRFGTAVADPNGTFSVTGSQELTGSATTATNYFWLVYDLDCAATAANLVDAECTAVYVGGAQTPTVTAPTGTRSITAATYTAVTSQSSTASVLQGAVNAQILRVALTGCANKDVTRINFSTTGSTNAASDIVRARVFYTTTTTFATTTQFGLDVAAPNGTFTVDGTQPLTTGTGYFWLVYDLAPTATVANVIDASCIDATINGIVAVPATPNPTGTRTIAAQILNDEATGAITLTVGAGCTTNPYDNTNATQSVNEPFPACDGTAGYAGMWYKFVAPSSGAVKVSCDGTGTLGDSRLSLLAATNASDYTTFTNIACDDDNGVIGSTRSLLYATGLTSGTTYYVLVDLFSSAGTRGSYCVTVDPLVDTMLSTIAGNCVADQASVAGGNAAYTGWYSLVDATGKLNALVRQTAGTATGFSSSRTITTGASRVDASGNAYLNRNFLINGSGATSAEVQLFFTDAELASLGGTLVGLNASRVAGTTCVADYPGGATLLSQTGNGSAGGISWVKVTTPGFSNFYLHQGNAALPITLVYFNGTKSATANNLNWKVNCTSVSVSFEIERSANGRNFTSIGTLNATQARCLTPFDFADSKPLAGVNYYRIKITDVDGKVSYTDIVVINNKKSGIELVGIQPTLVNSEAVLYIAAAKAGKLQIAVTDNVGRQIQIRTITVIEGDNKVSLNFGNLAAGVYNLSSINESTKSTIRFVKQ